MKNHTKSIVLLLTAALVLFSFAACGGKDEASSSVSGKTFAFESCTTDGEDMTETITAIYTEQTFAFKEDGTCVQTVIWSDEMADAMGSSDPVEQSGTYTEDGDTVTVTFASDDGDLDMTFTVDGDTLTMSEDGSEMIYKLQ